MVSNHPNTLYDPLNIAVKTNRMIHFLMNAGLWKNPMLGWFLTNTYGIKVERKADVSKGEKLDNTEAFRLAEDFLATGGCLYVAPEGGSDIPRRLRKVKTGTARIALSTENRNAFDLGLEILPVGLNYSSQTKFRSGLFINVGKPIKVADFKDSYQKENFQAALKLTAEMDKQMRALIIDTQDDEEDAFLRKLETVSQTEEKLPLDQVYDRSQKLLKGWRNFQAETLTKAKEFQQSVHSYFDFLEKNKIRDHIIVKTQQTNFLTKWIFRFIGVLLGMPFFIYGWVNNFLANYTPAWVFKKLGIHVAYTSTVKILVGLFAYLIFYSIQLKLVQHFSGEKWIGWVYLVSILIIGLFALWFKDFAKDTFSGWRVFQKNKSELNAIWEKREIIVSQINQVLLTSVAKT